MTVEELIPKMCPHCAAGNAPRRRPETGEWVHDYDARNSDVEIPGQGGPTRLLRGTFAHTLCQATDLRNGAAHE
jgi:hypothetical protein